MPTSSPRSDSKPFAASPDGAAGRALERELAAELARRAEAGLLRRLEPVTEREATGAGARLDLTSSDVLGLSRHPEVVAAAHAELDRWGAGGRAARLLGGGSPAHARAEAACADWLGAEAALIFPSGYQANLGLIGALAGRGDCVLSDELNHASLIDAARLSRAQVRVYRHLDLEELDRALRASAGARRRLVVTESVFSMAGDLAPLAEIHELCRQHDAWLVVDEAHATGVVGPSGAGGWAAASAGAPDPGDVGPAGADGWASVAREGADPRAGRNSARGERALGAGDGARLAARVVTCGKALGCAGAFAVGSAVLREYLLNVARTFVYTTASPPATAAAIEAAISVCRRSDDLRARLRRNSARLAELVGLPPPPAAILPIEMGDSLRALEAERDLREQGFEVRAVRPPTAPRALLRAVVHAELEPDRVDALGRALARWVAPPTATSGAGPISAPVAGQGARRGAGRVLFVAGTDTGIGKTVAAALLVAAGGPEAVYWKPVQTGDDDDTAEVARLAGRARAEFPSPEFWFPLPASPHEAAAAAGSVVDPEALRSRLAKLRAATAGRPLVVELAGGLLVPLVAAWTQLDWLAEERPELVLVARSGLGTLNHTLLSFEALQARHLEPRALFLMGEHHPSNRDTLKSLRNPRCVVEVPILSPLGPSAVAEFVSRTRLGPLFPA